MNIPFFLFEMTMTILFVICFFHARRNSVQNIVLLVSGVIYGVLLEWATIQQLDAYSYGKFLFMIAGEVPLMIGVGWGVILYSAMLFSNGTKLPWYLRPVLDGVLALNIDLAMDAAAIRFGMWDWGLPMTEDYFGVPFENFWAWFWVIVSFSLAFRTIDRYIPKIKTVAAILAIPLGTAGVMFTNWIITKPVSDAMVPAVIAVLFAVVVAVLYKYRRECRIERGHWLTSIVPLVFHLFFLIGGIVAGFLTAQPILLVLALFWCFAGVAFHRLTTIQ